MTGLSDGLRRFASGMEASAASATAEIGRGSARIQAALAMSQRRVVGALADHDVAVRAMAQCQAVPQNDCRQQEAAVSAARAKLEEAKARHAANIRCSQVFDRGAEIVQHAVRDLRSDSLPRIGPARTTLTGLADTLRAYLTTQAG